MSQEYSREQILIDLQSNDIKIICNALLGVAFYESDWHWAQNQCLAFLQNNDNDIKRISVTCLGHIARIHGKIDRKKVMPILYNYLDNMDIKGQAQDALDDIKLFVR